jgi:DNA/RNA endonuclease YhcR with UshA esterase domain
MKRAILGLVFGLAIATVTPLIAHHSFDAEYDSKKIITITGYVTKLDWVNPHAYVSLDVKDETGTVETYKVEMGPPYALQRGGWTKETIKTGDKITIEGAAAAKDGSKAGGSLPTTSMLIPSGKKMVMR